MKLTIDTLGIDESTHSPFRATPVGFSANTLLVTQGCATFVLLTSPGHPFRWVAWADIDPPRWGFQVTIVWNGIVASGRLKGLSAKLTKRDVSKPILNNMKAT